MGQRWWDRPALPYLMLVASPLLTLPISATILLIIPGCGEPGPPGEPLGSTQGFELGYFEIALLPALADLLPFLWLVSRTPGVKRAAIVAGRMGLARYAIPQVLTLTGALAGPECAVSGFGVVLLLFPIMLILWFVSAIVVAVILWTRGAETRD